jgi:glycosyltransferase involved in cell wall biosynthesis
MGGFEYIKSLAVALGSLPTETQAKFKLTLITNDPLGETDHAQFAGTVSKVISLENDLPPRTLTHRLKLKVRRKLFREDHSRFDDLLNHHRINFVYPYVPEHNTPKSYSYAAWIPDFQHKHLPDFFSSDEINVRNARYERMARMAPVVVLSSRNAENDFKKNFPFAANKSRILSFHTPYSEGWFRENPCKIQHEYNLPDKFFLVANQFWKHKNHLLVFRALKQLAEQGLDIPMVFTGNLHDYRFPEYSDTILQTVHKLGIRGQVFLLGVVPRAHYIQLLRRCVAVVQPSLFEGWSTVIEDARSIGKPVILSDLAVHLEQKPPRSIFFKQTSAENLVFHLGEQWCRLTPGPDIAQEEIAKRENDQHLRNVGLQFLEISQEAQSRVAKQ